MHDSAFARLAAKQETMPVIEQAKGVIKISAPRSLAVERHCLEELPVSPAAGVNPAMTTRRTPPVPASSSLR